MMKSNEIIEWSKSNIHYLTLENCVEWLKNAQPYEKFPEQVRIFFLRFGGQISFDTAEFAHFLGEFVDVFKSCVSELDRGEE